MGASGGGVCNYGGIHISGNSVTAACAVGIPVVTQYPKPLLVGKDYVDWVCNKSDMRIGRGVKQQTKEQEGLTCQHAESDIIIINSQEEPIGLCIECIREKIK